MKPLILTILLHFSVTTTAQQWLWAKNVDSTLNTPSSIAIDPQGYFYISSNLTNPSNPSIGSSIIKFDAMGNEVWRKQFTGTVQTKGIEYRNNNLYITGSFENNLAIGNTTLSSNGLKDIFLCEMTDSGNFTWAKSFGGPKDDFGNAVTSDANGFIYITGAYSDTAAFDTYTLACQGSANIYVAKLNTNGNIDFLKSSGAQVLSQGYSTGTKIKLDQNSNIWVLSRAVDVVIDTIHLSGYYMPDELMWVLNNHGVTITAKKYAGSRNATDFALNPAGGFIAINNKSWTNGNNIYTGWFNSNFNYVWENGIGNNPCTGNYLSGVVNVANNIYVAGTNHSQGCNQTARNRLFISKYDWLAANLMNDTVSSSGNTGCAISNVIIVPNAQGELYIAGDYMKGKLFFTNNTIQTNVRKLFIAKFSESAIVTDDHEESNSTDFMVYPNPTSGAIKIKGAIRGTVCIQDIYGSCILNNESDPSGTSIDMSDYSKGLYFVSYLTDRGRTTKKILLK